MSYRKSICIPAAPPVDVTEFAPIIEHSAFQRLRGIKQLGINDLIFPGAMHSRFEHAIGVLGLAQRICSMHKISGDESRLLQSFALLHDIGHGPYSHQLEPVLDGNHHQHGVEVIREMASVIRECGVEPDSVVDMLTGENPLSVWISDRNLGADKLDYLHRDALHIGFGGIPDIERIQFYTEYIDGHLQLAEHCMEDGKQLQKFYSYLHQHGYLNKTALIAQRMLQRAAQEAMAADDGDATWLWNAKDYDLFEWLRNSASVISRRMISYLEMRRLHKAFITFKPLGYGYVEKRFGKALKVFELPRKELSALATKFANANAVRQLEDALAEKFGLRAGDILISAMPYFKKLIPCDIIISAGDGIDGFSLFANDHDHVTSLESDYLRTFAIRFAVISEEREKMYELADEIMEYLKS